MKHKSILNLLIVLIMTLNCVEKIHTLTVDNQLVSMRNDCFERIAFGAMLPFEKAFRMEDMNLLSRCQELCLKEGEKCQTLAFGIHASRNGTCQLSSEKITPTNAQPLGTIFDPDFDLYARKVNCFDLPSNNQITPSNNDVTPFNDGNTQNNRLPLPPPYGTSTTFGVPNKQTSPSYPPTVGTSPAMDEKYSPRPTYSTGDTGNLNTVPANNQFTSNGVYYSNEIDRNRLSTERPTDVYDQSSGSYGNKIHSSNDGSLYPNQMLYETNYPMPNDLTHNYPGVYAENVPTVENRYRPPDMMYVRQPQPTVRPIYGLGYGNGYSYGTPDPNRVSSMGPNYNRDRPSINNGQNYPGTIYKPISTRPDTDRNGYSETNKPYDRDYGSRPEADYDNKRRPEGNGYEPSNRRPSPNEYGGQRPQETTGSSYGQNRPLDKDYGSRPDADYDNKRYPEGNGYESSNRRPPDTNYGGQRPQDATGSGYGQTRPVDISSTMPPYAQNGRPQDNKPQYQGSEYSGGTTRPQDQFGYQGDQKKPPGVINSDNTVGFTRPGYGGSDQYHTDQPDYGYRRDKPQQRPTNPPKGPDLDSYNRKPEGNYNSSDNNKRIETYFNPDDYYQTRWTTKPTTYNGGSNGVPTDPNEYEHDRYPIPMNACFRRVLAGKRIASHWVRRTIACERVEECMRECGYENRFRCEGFNYRLDPSGHGQGDCELIEIPLAEMDLYSSGHSRDSNLLRHPDYDYYERDRNAPSSCHLTCKDCNTGSSKPISSSSLHFQPSGYEKPYYPVEQYLNEPVSSGYGGESADRYRPSNTAIDKYRPPQEYDTRPDDYHRFDFSSQSHHEISSNEGYYRPGGSGSSSGYGGDRIDRYDVIRPEDTFRPASNSWQSIPSSHGQPSYGSDFQFRPIDYIGTNNDRSDYFRPGYHPDTNYSPYRPPQHVDDPYGPAPHSYLNRDRSIYNKPSKFIPYLIGIDRDTGSYGGRYGGTANQQNSNYWGIRNENRRIDNHIFNYHELGGNQRPSNTPIDNSIYPGSRYGGGKPENPLSRNRYDYNNQWTRRAGPDECSVKSSEGFRLHKNAIRHAYTVPTITECEKLCSAENKFICQTYSYRYSQVGRDNCLLCDRPVNLLDYYADIEPDRNYDIYSMSDEHKSCGYSAAPISTAIGENGGRDSSSTSISDPRNNAHCFFRAIDATRFFKSIVRDSLMVRSIGECELECIKSSKFSCRAFAFRYGQRTNGGVIDNCQLSDWPVRDMDKERHLILDPSFDVFERASYGHGCEIQPIVDDKHKKLCYLGYGSAAKLLTAAIKKAISVNSEVECKKECTRFRESTSFKCYSFSYGSEKSKFNCEMSDLDQTQLKLNIHYTHVNERDYWLFAWNPFDWTCRDKVTTIGGNRVNNDRRMDIFREPGDVTWRHYTVSGKPCRVGSGCDKNLITGFYSCEINTSEVGSWDYCCKADHPCGYSQGFKYPWCFVGDKPDQWRKCSDRYFPANNTEIINNNITLPAKDHHKKKPQDEYQRPPRPGGLQTFNDFTAARLWPVTYLYNDGPPNSTEFTNFVDCNKEIC